MIVSASRRTDIPAFYCEWFMNRLRAGVRSRAQPDEPAPAAPRVAQAGRRRRVRVLEQGLSAAACAHRRDTRRVPHRRAPHTLDALLRAAGTPPDRQARHSRGHVHAQPRDWPDCLYGATTR